jgi:hypothetical protein
MRHISYCHATLDVVEAESFLAALPERIRIVKSYLGPERLELLLAYGPVLKANQDDIKRVITPLATSLTQMYYRTTEHELAPEVQIGPSPVPSLAVYLRAGHPFPEAKRRMKEGIQP